MLIWLISLFYKISVFIGIYTEGCNICISLCLKFVSRERLGSVYTYISI